MVVLVEVLDCQYKYGRYFLNVSFIYLGESLIFHFINGK